MESTASHPRLSRQRLASPPRCKSARSRCRLTQNHKRSLHRNQQYSITALTDASGTIIERYAYTAYGTPTITDASGATRTTTAVGNRYTYTGREWDETLALYHFRARMYDAVGGRFGSRDPIGFNEDGVLLYEYVRGNPTRYHDPYGLEAVDPAGNKCDPGSMCLVAVCSSCGDDNWERQMLDDWLNGNPVRPPETGHAAVCWNCKSGVKNSPDDYKKLPRSPAQGCRGLRFTGNPLNGTPHITNDFEQMKKSCKAAYMYKVCPETIRKVIEGIIDDMKDPPPYNVFGIPPEGEDEGENCTTWACKKLKEAGIPCPLVIDPRTICNDPDSVKRRK